MLYFHCIFAFLGTLFLLIISATAHATKAPDFRFLNDESFNSYACSAIPEKNSQSKHLNDTNPNAINTCNISAYSALQQLTDRQSLLIDVRSQSEYKKFSIPGSLNIPLYALKTKAFLKDKKLLLINDGSNSLGLNKICHELRDEGIQTQIVTGGFNSWSKISNVFNQDKKFITTLDQMLPEAFFQELFQPDVLLISFAESLPFTNSKT